MVERLVDDGVVTLTFGNGGCDVLTPELADELVAELLLCDAHPAAGRRIFDQVYATRSDHG